MTNKEKARILRSAASALEHGRLATARKKLTQVTTPTFDSEELATILASLRAFQEKYENWDADAIREDWPEHFEDIQPLGTADISDLCERLNCGEI